MGASVESNNYWEAGCSLIFFNLQGEKSICLEN